MDIGADFGGQHTGEEANLNGMGQHIFAVAVAVFKAAEQADQFRVQAADAHLKGGVLAGAPDGLFNVLLGAVDAFLDAGGLDAPVLDQLGQRQSRDFPAHRVEAGQGYDAGAVVDEDFDPGAGLQGPYVTSFAADETAFHLIVGQGDNGGGAFRDDVGGKPVDGEGKDATGVFVGPGLVLLFQFVVAAGQFVGRFLLGALEHDGAGFVGGQRGHPFQFAGMLPLQIGGFVHGGLGFGFPLGQLGFLLFQGFGFAVKLFLTLVIAAFHPVEFASLFGDFLVAGLADLERFLLRLQDDVALFLLGLRNGVGGFLAAAPEVAAVFPGREQQPNHCCDACCQPCGRQDGQDDDCGRHRPSSKSVGRVRGIVLPADYPSVDGGQSQGIRRHWPDFYVI